jgi:cysteine synthase B
MLNQFANEITGKHIIKLQVQRFGMTHGTVTHFVAAMGTTGTIMGTSTYLKRKSSNSDYWGQPASGSQIPVSVNGQKNIYQNL